MRSEVLTIDLLNKLFNPNPTELRPKQFCQKCQGRGIWSRLESSMLDPGLKREMWYWCECRKQPGSLKSR